MDVLTRQQAGQDAPARSRRRSRLPMAVLSLLVLAAIGAAFWFRPAPTPDPTRGRGKGEAIPVLTAKATKADVPIYLDGLGTVQAFQTVTVRPQVDGKLIEMRFTEGQNVKAGDVLAKIDPTTYQAALDQALGKLAQDQALLTNARLDLVRYQKLAATAYTTAQQSDTQKALVAQLEAQLRQDQAQIDNARAQLAYTTLTAPIDGRIGIRQVDAGNIVHASDEGDADGPARRARHRPERRIRQHRHAAGSRHADGAGQSGRFGHGHDPAEGHLPEPEPETVAGRLHRRAAARGYGTGRHHRAGDSGPARPARQLFVCHRRRRYRYTPQRDGRA